MKQNELSFSSIWHMWFWQLLNLRTCMISSNFLQISPHDIFCQQSVMHIVVLVLMALKMKIHRNMQRKPQNYEYTWVNMFNMCIGGRSLGQTQRKGAKPLSIFPHLLFGALLESYAKFITIMFIDIAVCWWAKASTYLMFGANNS